jgi:hypothetical protein
LYRGMVMYMNMRRRGRKNWPAAAAGRELNELLAPGSGRQAGMRAASTGDSCC